MNPERKQFLTAIREQPDDDTLRLVYADWLDDHGTGDLDVATAEFIRMSCRGIGEKAPRFMPREVYPWLLGPHTDRPRSENWFRLLPSAVAVHSKHAPLDPAPVATRSGRKVSCSLWLPCSPSHGTRYAVDKRRYAAEFEFQRGFLKTATLYSVHAASLLLEALHDDQPLFELVISGLRRDRALYLFQQFEALAGEGPAKRFLARCG